MECLLVMVLVTTSQLGAFSFLSYFLDNAPNYLLSWVHYPKESVSTRYSDPSLIWLQLALSLFLWIINQNISLFSNDLMSAIFIWPQGDEKCRNWYIFMVVVSLLEFFLVIIIGNFLKKIIQLSLWNFSWKFVGILGTLVK